MAERTLKTVLEISGVEKYLADTKALIVGLDELTAAVNRANEAIKEFDALLGRTSNLKHGIQTSSNSAPQ